MSYTIEVIRGENSGTLKFKSGAVSVNTTCWWDPEVKIDAGTYEKCSASWMKNKTDGKTKCPWMGNKIRREGIFLGLGVPVNGRTSNDIFIHKGKNASWSDGCIVAAESQVWKIWEAITPKDGRNVTVIVRDQQEARIPRSRPIDMPCTIDPWSARNRYTYLGRL